MPTFGYVGTKLALSAVQPVMGKLGSFIDKEIDRYWTVDKNLTKLKATYFDTRSRISRLDSWHLNETNSTMEGLLDDVNRYCYDIEDVVDDLELSFPTKKNDQHLKRSFIFKSWWLAKVPHQIGELQEKLEFLNSLIETVLSAGPPHPQNGGRAHNSKSLYDKTPLVPGTSRDTDKRIIISKLVSQQSKHCGVSIIGMDGLGKTSLAQTILLHQSIAEHFDLVLSACVSGHFQMKDVVGNLVRDHSPLTLEQIVGKKKTLIILDDIWSVTDEDWDRFKSNYLFSSQDWRILTTTGNPKVAEVTESHSFFVDRMTDEDCKMLIEHRVSSSKFSCDVGSDEIEVIAKKCYGSPILADKVGLSLSKKQTADERNNYIVHLCRNELRDLEEFRPFFLSPILTEPKLPPDLKRCFAYCSLFPTSHEFNMDDLIQLWEVEGLTQSPQTERFCHEMNRHFEDLLSRAILQPIKSKDKKQMVYKMHELNHELSHILASKAICRLEEPNLFSSSKSLRHLSLACHDTDEPLLSKIRKCEGLRTFLLLHHGKPKERAVPNNFFLTLHRLRLLDLSHTNIGNLPKPKFPSKHLRFLDLSYSSITKLPDSVCSIRALRILKLKGCKELRQLPNDFHYLTNLTDLHVDMKILRCLPSNFGKLTKLEVLDSFSVGKDDCCKAVELQDMELLKEIHIFNLENIRSKKEAKKTKLTQKSLLRKLVLEWSSLTEIEMDAAHASKVLEGLQPHIHLTDLAVRNYAGKSFPKWLVSKVSPSCKIASLNLENYPNCEGLPSLSQLKVLTNLVFRSIHKVETLDQFCGEGETVYPCLELLEFHDMKALEKWSGLKPGNMPRLSSLKIVKCPKLINLPSFESLGCLINLEIGHCPALLSLPELPPSMKSDSGKLVIVESGVVASRCEPEGADRPKIDYIPYVEIDFIRIENKSYPPSHENIKVTEHHSSMLENGNSKIQVNESRISISKGKQKVDEGSSSNQVQVAQTLPQNQLTEQAEAQLSSPSSQSTGSEVPPKHSKRGISLFFRKYLLSCSSPVK